MTADEPNITQQSIPSHPRGKSPGRVLAMQRLNASGRGAMGGRRPKHGRRALEELLKRGMGDIEGPEDGISILHRELVSAYVADLGGAENCSNMQMAIVKRLVALDMDQLLLTATRDRAANLSLEKKLALSQAINRNSAIYFQGIKTLGGPVRRPAKTLGKVTIERFQNDESQTQNSTGE